MWLKRLLIKLSEPDKYILDFYQKISITFTFFIQNELRNHAAAGAYYMLLSIIPLVLLMVIIFETVMISFPGFSSDIFAVLSVFNDSLTPEMFEKFGISKKAGSAIGALGIINLLFSSRLILSSIQRAFGVIFPAKKKRDFLTENIISLCVIPVVFVLTVALGIFNSTREYIYKYLQINGISTYYIEPLFNLANYVVPAFIAFVLVFLTFRYLPVKKPNNSSAFKGSFLFLIIFVLAKSLVYSIFKKMAVNTAYGLLGSLIVVLVWAYFCFWLFFFCAQYVFVTYRADILILNRLFSDEKLSNRFMIVNKKILEKYSRNLKAGETLFEMGEKSESVYYLLSGALEALVHDKRIGTISADEVLGEMAHITGEPRSATVKAIIDSELIVLPSPLFDEIIKDNSDLARRLMETLCLRLKKAQTG